MYLCDDFRSRAPTKILRTELAASLHLFVSIVKAQTWCIGSNLATETDDLLVLTVCSFSEHSGQVMPQTFKWRWLGLWENVEDMDDKSIKNKGEALQAMNWATHPQTSKT